MERVTVIGIGRIGLCLALNLDRAGYEVLGIDKNDVYVRQVNEKKLCTSEPGVEVALQSARKFKAVDNIAPIRDFAPDLIFVAVDTPTAEGGGYDHGRVDCVLEELFRLEPWRTRVELALVCTTFPGYCDSKAALARSHSYALSYNPGFIAQGSILRDQLAPDQVLIGEADAVAGEKLESIYRTMCLNQPAIHRMTPLSAEIAKLATNCALTMKIAFANAIGDLASSVGAQPERVLAAIGADSRIGNKFFKYGFGYGGPCFARDNQALDMFAKQYNFDFPQANVTDEMNRGHLMFQVNHYLCEYREDEQIQFYFVTYKPGTEILEESQPLALAVQLAQAGRKIVISESPAVLANLRRQFGNLFTYKVRAESD